MRRLGRTPGRRAGLLLAVPPLSSAPVFWLAFRGDPPPTAPHHQPPPRFPGSYPPHYVGGGCPLCPPGVEAVVGRPNPKDVGPVESSDGQAVYRVRYTAILTAPLPSAPAVSGYCEAELVYDASQNGHPLLRITVTPKPPPSNLSLATA